MQPSTILHECCKIFISVLIRVLYVGCWWRTHNIITSVHVSVWVGVSIQLYMIYNGISLCVYMRCVSSWHLYVFMYVCQCVSCRLLLLLVSPSERVSFSPPIQYNTMSVSGHVRQVACRPEYHLTAIVDLYCPSSPVVWLLCLTYPSGYGTIG